MERTLILCKPDCMQKNLAGEVIGRFQKAGLRIQAAKVLRLTDALLSEHYSHLTDKPFFPEIVQFMKSAPVLALILTGDQENSELFISEFFLNGKGQRGLIDVDLVLGELSLQQI
mgnify:CR=1 FL=1